jgi:hypothetical protein
MPSESPNELTEETLSLLRHQPDAIAVITALLGVKEMGPADHIRTKHEVRDYVATGDPGAARAVLQHAKDRREFWKTNRTDPK